MNFANTIILSAANPWDGIPMADQQLAQALSAIAPVMYVDPPRSLATRFRGTGKIQLSFRPRVEHLGERFIRVTPEVFPGLSRPGIAAINRRIIARQVNSVLQEVGGTAASVIEANILTPIMGRCNERQQVYWAQDDFAGMAPLVGKSRKSYAKADARLAAQADRIIAANPQVAQSHRDAGHRADLIPFGCDHATFSATLTATPADDVSLPGRIAVFMGHLGDRIDLDILESVAQSGVSLLLIGPLHGRTELNRFQSILNMANVQWVKEKSFEQLPQYLAHGAVGLLPYTKSDFNLGSFPLKTLEYLAAGLPVVATSLPAMAWLNTNHIQLADTPEAFAELTSRMLREKVNVQCREDRSAFAAGHTWDNRASSFAEVLGIASGAMN